jgi:hypothetical protein
MKKIGLALSGGGFRATLFHLGLVRDEPERERRVRLLQLRTVASATGS